MSGVSVATDASSVGANGIGVLIAVGAVVAYGVNSAGANFKNLSYYSAVLAMVIVGVVLWLLLTDVKKLTDLVAANQLVSIVLAGIVAVGPLMQLMATWRSL